MTGALNGALRLRRVASTDTPTNSVRQESHERPDTRIASAAPTSKRRHIPNHQETRGPSPLREERVMKPIDYERAVAR
jgi:hypothetical protein